MSYPVNIHRSRSLAVVIRWTSTCCMSCSISIAESPSQAWSGDDCIQHLKQIIFFFTLLVDDGSLTGMFGKKQVFLLGLIDQNKRSALESGRTEI